VVASFDGVDGSYLLSFWENTCVFYSERASVYFEISPAFAGGSIGCRVGCMEEYYM